MFLLRQTPNTLSEECTAFDLVYNSLYIYITSSGLEGLLLLCCHLNPLTLPPSQPLKGSVEQLYIRWKQLDTQVSERIL